MERLLLNLKNNIIIILIILGYYIYYRNNNSYEEFENTYKLARSVGFNNINIDLIDKFKLITSSSGRYVEKEVERLFEQYGKDALEFDLRIAAIPIYNEIVYEQEIKDLLVERLECSKKEKK